MSQFTLSWSTVSLPLNDLSSTITTDYQLGSPKAGGSDAVDSFEVIFFGTSRITTIRLLDRIVQGARDRLRSGRGPRAKLTVRFDTDTSDWSAEVFEIEVDPAEAPGTAVSGKISVKIIIRREPGWTGTGIALPSRSTLDNSYSTAGRRISNNPALGSFLEVRGSDLTGSLPSPIKLTLSNTSAAQRTYTRVYAASEWTGGTPLIQGETSILSGTNITAPSFSGTGYWLSGTITATASLLGIWPIDQTLVDGSDSRWWRLIGALSHTPAHNPRLWPVIYHSDSSTVLWTGEPILLSTLSTEGLVDLGPVPIPPGESLGLSRTALRLGLWGIAKTATSIILDYFYFMPVDTLRFLDQSSQAVATNQQVVIDEYTEDFYILQSNLAVPIWVPDGEKLMLWPGVDQRIHVLEGLSGSSDLTGQFTATVTYYPRRLTL